MKPLFDEVRHNSRSRQIVEKFREKIAEGTLKVGDKLPPERELCLQLGISRTALREAIRTLEAYGIVEARQGGGTFITDRFTENVFEFLGFGDRLDYSTILQLLKTRSIIESGAIESIVTTATDNDIALLESLAMQLKTAAEQHSTIGDLDAIFHKKIIELTNNKILMTLYQMIWKMLSHSTSMVIAYPTARKIAVDDHLNIVDTLKRRDVQESKQSILKHLQHTEELLNKYFLEKE